jgi:3-hydroxybutyryl-CoA dehydrogenase
MKKPFRKVAVVGTGVLGTQIAMLAANAGYRVKVYDPVAGAFEATYRKIHADLKAKKASPLIPWEKWEKVRKSIVHETDLASVVKDADLVVEAVPEILDLKKKVWTDLGNMTKQGAILATNSSSMPVSKMEKSGGRLKESLNIHFYFPLQGVNMVDIMGGTKTDRAVFDKGTAWIVSLGCIPLKVRKEILGFCFNRVWRAIKRETLYMWGNGFVDFRDTDRAWRVFTGMREGPFALMDKVGLDVIHDIEMVYYKESKDPKDKPPDALLKMIKRGELGVKSGKGFYTYPNPEFLRADFMKPKK